MNLILALILIWVSFSVGALFFSGLMVRKRSTKYIGVINVAKMEDKLIYSLELDRPAEDLQDMEEVWFKVRSPEIGTLSQENHRL